MTECLEECDDLILWFSEGKYVYKAMELKMQYKPLSPSQQQKYDHRYEKLSSETEEIPDLASYLGEDEEKDSASEGAEALGDTRSIGLTEQPVMENDSTSDVIDTDVGYFGSGRRAGCRSRKSGRSRSRNSRSYRSLRG